MKRFFLFITVFTTFLSVFAKEGMWVPTLLDKYNIEEMQAMGFRLTAEDVYSINQNSMKDALVIFGKGCTGEIISGQGLLLTNHHCGFSNIQSHSTIENDYLTDGFWAMSQNEELPNPGLTAKFLEQMVDVSDSVFFGTDTLQVYELQDKLKENILRIQQAASDSGKYEAIVKPLFSGNQYFLYIYKVYRDVRLVGAPPTAIGKFGGDTDNWMWPRHTGDFSIFRVYADENNEPAEYSEDNVPYQPKTFLPISMQGVKPDDFIMIMGYPGTTQEYLPSQAVNMIMHQSNPDKIKIRTAKLSVFSKHMNASPKVRIQYASKYAKTSNSWKKWKGEIKGLERLEAIKQKHAFETKFKKWYDQNDSLKSLYESVFPQFEKLYIDLQPFEKANNYYQELVFKGTDVFKLAEYFPRTDRGWKRAGEERRERFMKALAIKTEEYFDDYDPMTDQDVFVRLLRLLKDDLDPSFLPGDFIELWSKYDEEQLIKKVYRKSILADKQKLMGVIHDFDSKWISRLQKDPIIRLYQALRDHYARNVENVYRGINTEIEAVQKKYMVGILAMEKDKHLYPDANFTMRIAYGKVEGYQPRDAVNLRYYTTLEGIMEKDNPELYDYNVPQKLRDIFHSGKFGNYAPDGYVPVAFTGSVHTTGGNSGSPAINADGQLVGLNFDRCWEGTMSDIMFDPDQCRNIMLDVRYVLFIIDKFAGAGYLLDEMNLVGQSISEVINQ